jgi:uncharacterized protein YbaR (Trm112 family)
MLDSRLLDILACPLCKAPLHRAPLHGAAPRLDDTSQQLICRADRLAFPVRDGIPVLLESEARPLAPDDPLLER